MLNIKNISKYLVVSLKMRNFALAFERKKYGGIAQLVRASDS